MFLDWEQREQAPASLFCIDVKVYLKRYLPAGENMESDIIQIMPTSQPAWVHYQDEAITNTIVALGLKKDGSVVFLDSDDDGCITEIGDGGRLYFGKLPKEIERDLY